jgi:hypothetical protein
MANTTPYGYKPPELKSGLYVTHFVSETEVYEIVWVYIQNIVHNKTLVDCKNVKTTKVEQFDAKLLKPFHIQKGDLYSMEALHTFKIVVVMELEFRKATGITAKCVVGETTTEILNAGKSKKMQKSLSINSLAELPIIDETYATSV